MLIGNYTTEDLDLLELLVDYEAREDFYAFRKRMHPKMKLGWFTREISFELQAFYENLIAGNRPKLAISAPPQHGKSTAIVDFVAWLAGKHPDTKTIYTSFSKRLGVRANLALQRVLKSDRYIKIFPHMRIDASGITCNRDLIEYDGQQGYFRNTTVRGSITGESLDCGIIDDPLKGRSDANSETVRNAVWDWLTDDFLTRFSDEAGLLIIMTRWHIDDPLSRLIAEIGDDLKVVNFQAIADVDEKFRKAGEPLFPDLKSLTFLEAIKKIMLTSSWLSLFQGNPRQQGGELIRGEWFKRYRVLPKIEYRIIYVDTAQKIKKRNDYSVFEEWGKGVDGNIYLLDLLRGKWEAPDLKQNAIDFWAKCKARPYDVFGQLRKMKVEDKASGTGLIQEISRPQPNGTLIPVEGIPREIDKYTRVSDVLPTIQAGYVWIPEEAPWVSAFIAECEEFSADDSHIHDDQVDPMCDAINDMASPSSPLNVWAALGRK